jgi:hypothetical protein
MQLMCQHKNRRLTGKLNGWSVQLLADSLKRRAIFARQNRSTEIYPLTSHDFATTAR